MGNRTKSIYELFLVVAFCAFLFFYGLGSFGLVGADEPRYAQIAREMLARHDFVTPTLNGEAWLEKPALYYWRAMFAFETFGVKDWAARMPSATFALGMVVIIFFHMRRFRPGAQLDAAIITASSAAVIAFSRGASTDMQLAGPFTVAMLGWYAWYETGAKLWLLDLYLFLGVATLAKGPVAPVLAGAIVLVFCALRRDAKAALRSIWLPGVVLYFAIVLPWFVAVQMKNPEFLYVFILQHNLARFASDTFHHAQPFWYYIPIFLLALAPWTFFAIPALIDALSSCLKDWRYSHPARANGANVDWANIDSFPEFLVIWVLVPIVFFSLSQSKLPGYILPAIAPCTILTADFLQRRRSQPLSALVIGAHAALSACLVALFIIFPSRFLQQQTLTQSIKLLALGMSAAVFVAIYMTLRLTGMRYLRFVTLLPIVIILAFILRVAAPSIDDFYSARPVARDLAQMHLSDAPIAVFHTHRELRYGLTFYRNQKVDNYDENEVPAAAHLLVAKAGSLQLIQRMLGGRHFLAIGGFSPQKIEYFWVSAAAPAHSATPGM